MVISHPLFRHRKVGGVQHVIDRLIRWLIETVPRCRRQILTCTPIGIGRCEHVVWFKRVSILLACGWRHIDSYRSFAIRNLGLHNPILQLDKLLIIIFFNHPRQIGKGRRRPLVIDPSDDGLFEYIVTFYYGTVVFAKCSLQIGPGILPGSICLSHLQGEGHRQIISQVILIDRISLAVHPVLGDGDARLHGVGQIIQMDCAILRCLRAGRHCSGGIVILPGILPDFFDTILPGHTVGCVFRQLAGFCLSGNGIGPLGSLLALLIPGNLIEIFLNPLTWNSIALSRLGVRLTVQLQCDIIWSGFKQVFVILPDLRSGHRNHLRRLLRFVDEGHHALIWIFCRWIFSSFRFLGFFFLPFRRIGFQRDGAACHQIILLCCWSLTRRRFNLRKLQTFLYHPGVKSAQIGFILRHVILISGTVGRVIG